MKIYKPYRKGVWKYWCPVTGIVYYSDEVSPRWDGVLVGPMVEKSRHPRELMRIKPEKPIPYSSPVPEDTFVSYPCEGLYSFSCLADYAIADCAVADSTVGI